MAWFAPLLMTTALAACGAPERVAPLALGIAPMPELSGLAVFQDGGREFLLGVGDERYELLVMPWRGIDVIGTPDMADAFTIPLPLPPRDRGSDLEGVTIAPDGRVVVVSEPGEVYYLRLDLAARTAQLELTLPIVFPADHPLAGAWSADANERAEGIVFVGSRLFITKQKNPAALVELERRGERLVATSHWRVPMGDASDLAAEGETLFVLGGASHALCVAVAPTAGTGGDLTCRRSVLLPDGLEGRSLRWEGLALTRAGGLYLGADEKKTRRPNLAVLPRP